MATFGIGFVILFVVISPTNLQSVFPLRNLTGRWRNDYICIQQANFLHKH